MRADETFGNLLLPEEDQKTDPRIPTEDEKKKQHEIYGYLRSSEIKMLFMLYPTLVLIVITYFLDKHPVARFSIIMYAVIMLMGILYLMIKRELIKRCPRCSMRGVPPASFEPTRSNCPGCEMFLEPPDKKIF
ncbi:MAG: hypothetical protein PVG39_26090 [Desulfobacteraceae bacterium]